MVRPYLALCTIAAGLGLVTSDPSAAIVGATRLEQRHAAVMPRSSTKGAGQMAPLHVRGPHETMVHARQDTCPDPSTDQFCPAGSCFVAERGAASTWGTCCPIDFYLFLDAPEWSVQKCCPSGLSSDECSSQGASQPADQPITCGNGVRSGWGCVYAADTVSSATKRPGTNSMVAVLVLVLASVVYLATP